MKNVTRGLNQESFRSGLRFRSLFEQAHVSIQIFNSKGKTIRVNKAWEKLWGVKLSDISDYNILKDKQLVKKGIMSFIKRAFRGESVLIPPIEYFPIQTIPRLHDTYSRWTKAVMYPIKNGKGKVLEVVLIHEDITREKLVERDLGESKSRLEGIM